MTKPLDKYDSTDIAQLGRMSMHVDDYADLPDANLPPPDWEFRVYGVFCIALLLAVLVVAWRVL